MRRRSAHTVIKADSSTDGAGQSPPPAVKPEVSATGRRPHTRRGTRNGGVRSPRPTEAPLVVPSNLGQSLSHGCAVPAPVVVPKILCSLNAHRILTTATPFCSLLPPLAALANVPLYTREPLGRGGGPPYLGHGLRRPNFVPKFGASVRSSAPTEGQRCNSGLPASEQGCSPCIPGPGRRPPHCGSRDRSSLFAKGFDPLPDS